MTNMERFCHNLEGSCPDRPPSKSKIQYEKEDHQNWGIEI